jgi:hypothetical protein
MSEPASQGVDVGGVRKAPLQSTPTSGVENTDSLPRQVIAVSASKGPAAFFNLARKFLVTDEYCDLSALEGAIVAAVDAAHLLERSKLATIVRYVELDMQNPINFIVLLDLILACTSLTQRVTTSYVTVEPKRKKQSHGESEASRFASLPPPAEEHERRSSSRELRRARIVVTVRRTESYKAWLDENPLQAVIAGDVGDDSDIAAVVEGLAEA